MNMKNISALSCRSSLTVAIYGALFLSIGLPHARAVCQQGCGVGNDNTFLGDNATNTGGGNTAIGSATLFSNTSGSANTFTLAVDGATIGMLTVSQRGPVTIPWTTRSVANGAHTLTATVRDATGNTGRTSFTVTVRN